MATLVLSDLGIAPYPKPEEENVGKKPPIFQYLSSGKWVLTNNEFFNGNNIWVCITNKRVTRPG